MSYLQCNVVQFLSLFTPISISTEIFAISVIEYAIESILIIHLSSISILSKPLI